jgi:serpin B
MKTILTQMGMGIAYDPGKALFPNIAEHSNFYVERSMQKTFIRVDESGAEAAAVSEHGLKPTADLPELQTVTFRADRPFLFVIRENSTGTILFMGKTGDPTEK